MNDEFKQFLEGLHEHGKFHGKELVKYNISNVIITTDMEIDDFKENVANTAWEAEDGYRSYSPFEFFAKDLNDSEDPDAAWEAYEDGIADGINEEINDTAEDFFNERMEQLETAE